MQGHNWMAAVIVGAVGAFVPTLVTAQTCASFHPVKPNGKPSPVLTSTSTTDHVTFFFMSHPDRSYSVEVQTVSRSYLAGTLTVNVSSAASTCPIANSAGVRDTSVIEPTPQGSQDLRRFSLTTSASGIVSFRGGAGSGSVDMQATATETTLYSNWFFLGGDYGAFTLIRNTTDTSDTFAALKR